MSRRQFLVLAGGASAATALRLHGANAGAEPRIPERILVVVELRGGNDGLDTVVPADGRYRDLRPTIGVPEADLLRPPGLDGAGLHPSLAPLVPLWDAGRLAVVQGLGYEHPGRSHFECSQHWWDGVDPHYLSTTGWLGRWLDATAPSADPDPLRAVALGSTSPSLRSERAASTVVLDPAAFGITAPPGVDAGALTAGLRAAAEGESGDAARATVDALDAAGTLTPVLAADGGVLDVAAEVVTAGLGVQVVTVAFGGYDTHANQPELHARLLAELADGLARFQAAVEAAGIAERVLVVTTSEFGRRVAENGSRGTDHGLAGCQLVLGAGVRGQLTGETSLADLVDGDVRPTVDPRSLFATAIDWLGGPTGEVLGGYEPLGLLA